MMPPIPPEPPADNFSQNGARNTKLSQKAKHIQGESDAVEPVLGNDGPNAAGDGGDGKISLPVGVPGSVDEYSSGMTPSILRLTLPRCQHPLQILRSHR